MRISQLSLLHLRSYLQFSLEVTSQSVVIVGRNGSGKTNLLEAIYMLASGTSFRGRDRDTIQHGQTHAVAKLRLADGQQRQLRLQIGEDDRVTKQFEIDGTKRQRLSFAHKLPVVLFDPDGLRALSSSPARRRDFLDSMLTRLSPGYSTILSRYERALLQRNELLKKHGAMPTSAWQDQLFVWDIKLAELATRIVQERLALLEKINQVLPATYSQVADRSTKLRVKYDTQMVAVQYQQALLTQLQRQIERDAARGFTSLGPHRDDFVVWINEKRASETASRGELRTIMLAFKLIETQLLADLHGTPPLLLLDDVFSELDSVRRQKLVEATRGSQTIITTTDADVVALGDAVQLVSIA